MWTRHSIRCSHPAPDTNSPCVEKASVGAGAFVASASVWRVMYIWSRCGSGADTRVSRRQASVCWVSSPPARHCKAECQLGHYHRLTFAAALPTAQLSDIQGRCGGGRKGVGWWPVGCFFFLSVVYLCVCVCVCSYNKWTDSFRWSFFYFFSPHHFTLLPLFRFWNPEQRRFSIWYLVFFPPPQTCLLSKRLLLSLCEILAPW